MEPFADDGARNPGPRLARMMAIEGQYNPNTKLVLTTAILSNY